MEEDQICEICLFPVITTLVIIGLSIILTVPYLVIKRKYFKNFTDCEAKIHDKLEIGVFHRFFLIPIYL